MSVLTIALLLAMTLRSASSEFRALSVLDGGMLLMPHLFLVNVAHLQFLKALHVPGHPDLPVRYLQALRIEILVNLRPQ